RACQNILKELENIVVNHFAGTIIYECLGNVRGLEEGVRRPFANADDEDPRSLIAVLRYHAEKLPQQLGSATGAISLLGKEYLFVAIGIISAIQSIASFDWEGEEIDPNVRESVHTLFKGISAPWEKSPLYRYFHRERVEGGFWGTVPPGMVHSWQGGGNFLIELAERSDNTFRIVDWGRELKTATRRDMHYVEAMYCVSESSIVSTDAAKRLKFEAKRSSGQPTPQSDARRSGPRAVSGPAVGTSVERLDAKGDDTFQSPDQNTAQPCHAGLSYSIPDFRAKGTSDWRELKPDYCNFSLLMNPDNPLQVRVGSLAGTDAIQLTLPPATAALLNKNVTVSVRAQQADDTVFHITARADRDNLLVISLGTSRLELVLYADRLRPPTTSRICIVNGPSAEKGSDLLTALTQTLPREISTWSNINPGSQMPEIDVRKRIESVRRVGLVWPGPIEESQSPRKLYSTDWGNFDETQVKAWVRQGLSDLVPNLDVEKICIKGDTAVTALGEIRHPLGGLAAKNGATKLKPGAVLNLGGGVCAGFTSELKSPVSELGRWLYYDTRTGLMKPRFPPNLRAKMSSQHLRDAIADAVYCERPTDRDDVSIRVSRMFSFVGIMLRYLDRLNDRDRANFL